MKCSAASLFYSELFAKCMSQQVTKKVKLLITKLTMAKNRRPGLNFKKSKDSKLNNFRR